MKYLLSSFILICLPAIGLEIRNGWITEQDKLLTGGIMKTAWWGNHKGAALTRRATDGHDENLNDILSEMQKNGQCVFEHHQGLWYDRRRDTHTEEKRCDAHALPPFYEMPFARSNLGTAWDGLPLYDLTKYNDWYWRRLDEFSTLAKNHHVLLFHQHYFQHFVLESAAHWVDCPWRTNNNINHTDFTEPPRTENGRVFMADEFFDITHPNRKTLHQQYIRKCLDHAASHTNTIHFTCAEYTGPLHFITFWLDEIQAWEKEHGKNLFIALSCTKDVQDAILGNHKYDSTIDIVDFRYWWRNSKVEFAPVGGKSITLRQSERICKMGRPNDEQLAMMLHKYRSEHPQKAFICDFETASWQWLLAGGSLPRLPAQTDDLLLRTIPYMKANGKGILLYGNEQILVYGKQVDLTKQQGHYILKIIDPKSGMIREQKKINGGSFINMHDSVIFWLKKEKS